MIVNENVPLSSLTTFRIGGNARYVAECASATDLAEAVTFATEKGLPYTALGEGSNVLAHDEGYPGVVLHIRIGGIDMEDTQDGAVIVRVGAGIIWDRLVSITAAKGLWGIENLAGIPGTTGAAPVQNIGAYGAELSDTVVSVAAFDTKEGRTREFSKEECEFGYRDSVFKKDKRYVITEVVFKLQAHGEPRVSYKDLQALNEQGVALSTPREIAAAVRDVRSRKFPDLRVDGTAGSFFKNPVITNGEYQALLNQYPEMPGYETTDGVKVPLGWILDHVLSLRGFSIGPVRLYEQQALVLVAERGARFADVETLANYVAEKVLNTTHIHIEREVRTFE